MVEHNHSLEPKVDLDPLAVIAFLGEHEQAFLKGLQSHCQPLNLGSEIVNKGRSIFTGRGACIIGSTIVLTALENKFGQNINANFVKAWVQKAEIDPIGHTWLRFKGTQSRTYFIDSTYGQIVLSQNRILIERSYKEKDYYGLNREPDELSRNYFRQVKINASQFGSLGQYL